MGVTAIIGIIVEYLPVLMKAVKSVPEVMDFVKRVQEHLKQTKEWSAEQEAEFDRRLEEVTSKPHWQPEGT